MIKEGPTTGWGSENPGATPRGRRGGPPPEGGGGESCDNALAESIIGLFKTELIRRKGPWRNLDAVELATLEWVDWYNNRRLFEAIGDIPRPKPKLSTTSQRHRLQSCRWENPASIEPGVVHRPWRAGGLLPARQVIWWRPSVYGTTGWKGVG